jgi:hypothetical protein
VWREAASRDSELGKRLVAKLGTAVQMVVENLPKALGTLGEVFPAKAAEEKPVGLPANTIKLKRRLMEVVRLAESGGDFEITETEMRELETLTAPKDLELLARLRAATETVAVAD